MRKQKQKKAVSRVRSSSRDAGDLDWKPLYSALRDAFEWALDVAAKLAAPYPEEVEAIENVRGFVRAQLAGKPAEVRINDLMLTFGIIIAAIERDLPAEGGALLAAGPRSPAPSSFDPFWIPTGPELWEPTVPRHCPGAHTVFTRRMPLVHYAA